LKLTPAIFFNGFSHYHFKKKPPFLDLKVNYCDYFLFPLKNEYNPNCFVNKFDDIYLFITILLEEYLLEGKKGNRVSLAV
jgi:hypothetical protein